MKKIENPKDVDWNNLHISKRTIKELQTIDFAASFKHDYTSYRLLFVMGVMFAFLALMVCWIWWDANQKNQPINEKLATYTLYLAPPLSFILFYFSYKLSKKSDEQWRWRISIKKLIEDELEKRDDLYLSRKLS